VALGEDVDLVGRLLALLVRGPADRLADVFHAQPVLPPQLPLHLIEHGRGLGDLVPLAREAQLVLTVHDLHAKRIPDHAQIAIRGPKKGQLLVGLFKGDAEVHRGQSWTESYAGRFPEVQPGAPLLWRPLRQMYRWNRTRSGLGFASF
jgi:hypothetical protein